LSRPKPTRVVEPTEEEEVGFITKKVHITIAEKIKTYFVFKNFLPKIMPFMRQYGKIWYSQTGHKQ
jgi:hypothetical protein